MLDGWGNWGPLSHVEAGRAHGDGVIVYGDGDSAEFYPRGAVIAKGIVRLLKSCSICLHFTTITHFLPNDFHTPSRSSCPHVLCLATLFLLYPLQRWSTRLLSRPRSRRLVRGGMALGLGPCHSRYWSLVVFHSQRLVCGMPWVALELEVRQSRTL